MGLLSWLTGRKAPTETEEARTKPKATEALGMNGAMEVPRPMDVTVFEFGSAAASGDRFTLAGYCPVSDELNPCRWEILPAAANAPQFRIVF